MRSYTCDRCGASVDTTRLSPGRGVAGPENWSVVSVSTLGRNAPRVTDKPSPRYDLCPECLPDLTAFLKGESR